MDSPDRVHTGDLGQREVPAALELLHAEGWAFEEVDLRRLLHLGFGVGLEIDGDLSGLLTVTLHEGAPGGPRVAWIGNVVVAARLRGRGSGEVLVHAALDRIDALGIETTRLYSVLPAVSLYRRAGFREEGVVTSFAGSSGAAQWDVDNIRQMESSDLDVVLDLDRERFGADRSRLIRTLFADYPGGALVLEGESGGIAGYAFAKAATLGGGEIGPAVLREPDEAGAARLVEAALQALPPGNVEIALPDANGDLVRVLEARGFSRAFPTVLMTRGPGVEERPECVLGVAGLEKG